MQLKHWLHLKWNWNETILFQFYFRCNHCISDPTSKHHGKRNKMTQRNTISVIETQSLWWVIHQRFANSVSTSLTQNLNWCRLHTADTDKTRLSCLAVSAVWTESATSQDNFQYSHQYIWDGTVANWQLGRNWTKLSSRRISRQDKTVLSCRQFSSQRRHGQDKTVLSCPCRRCEIG